MSAITESARGEKCTIRLPGCNGDPDRTVFTHLNSVRLGKGLGLKVSDVLGAYGCDHCHGVVDGQIKTHLPQWQLQICFYEAVFETLLRLIAKGLVRIG